MAKSNFDLQILGNDDSLEEWDRFVDLSPEGCIFCRSWWLRVVCPESFKILILKKAGRIVAGMPLPISRILGMTFITMPPLTQTLGILLEPSINQKNEAKLSQEVELIDNLIGAIPSFAYFSMNFHYNFMNWLPFYWSGYSQTTYYTYLISDLTNSNKIFDDFSHRCRNRIKKAETNGIIVKESDDMELFLHLNSKTFARQGIKPPFSKELMFKINNECSARNSRKIFLAKDSQDRIHTALFVIYDHNSMYSLMAGNDTELRESGSGPLTRWTAIKLAGSVTKKYNFCGSIMPNVEPFMRSFGGIQMPYFCIFKGNRLLMKIGDTLKAK